MERGADGDADYAREQGLEAEWADVMAVIVQRRRAVQVPVWRPVPAGRLMEDGPTYGTPLTYSPMTYAPTCEDGVIFLFGSLAPRLGFNVERIQGAFPDCEAMREVSRERCKRVKIEFELDSRNFEKHGHWIRQGADLIVCWNHNWEECPLEVIELKKVMEELRKRMG